MTATQVIPILRIVCFQTGLETGGAIYLNRRSEANTGKELQ